MFASKTLKSALVALVAFSSFGLTSCKGRVSGTLQASASPSVAPADFNAPANDNYMQENLAPVIQAVANAQIGTVPVTGWQAKGIAVSGGTMYVSAFGPVKLVFTAGTVLKIGTDGKIKDFATGMLGTTHPIAKTVEGLSISGSTLFVADASAMYTVDATSGKVKTIKGAGGKDVAATASGVFVANGSVDKADAALSARSPIAGLSATGGVGADNTGSVYAVSGSTIKKADSSGQVMDIVTSDLSAPIDVAVDNRNGDLYVLEQSEVKRFNSSGSLLVKFPSGATTPAAITVDESGMIYVADTGTSKKDSKIVKFSASTDNASSSMSMNYSSSASSAGGSTNISSVDAAKYSRRR